MTITPIMPPIMEEIPIITGAAEDKSQGYGQPDFVDG
jgi:hypothetical protein